MSATDKKIAEVLSKFGEPMAGNIWRVQGTAVIYHKALERIAAQARIAFDAPTIIRAEKEEAVLLVTGRMGERMEWSFGEALIGANYRVSGKQAAYVWAMAEKRAKDRVILKLIELHGLVYSEEEADEFKEARPTQTESSPSSPTNQAESEAQEETAEQRIERELRDKISRALSPKAITDLMLSADTQRSLGDLPEDVAEAIKRSARNRREELRPRAA